MNIRGGGNFDVRKLIKSLWRQDGTTASAKTTTKTLVDGLPKDSAPKKNSGEPSK